jgi:hypothetical protein
MAQSYPELTRFSPRESEGVNTALRPEISFDWSYDIVTTQFSDPAELDKNVILVNDETSDVIELEYVSYNTQYRRITVQPAVDLVRGTRFRVVVKDKLQDTYGRKSRNQYQWTFYTAGTTIGKVSLVSPGDASVQSIFPTLTWEAPSSGTLNYLVQLDDRFDFGSLAWSSVTTGVSITPAGSFSANETYYWRVLAYTTEASGSWSNVASFFYGEPYVAHSGSRITLPSADPFGISRIGFKNGASHLKTHPTLTFTFTSTPASGYASFITVEKKSVLPRNDDVDTYFAETVAGTWDLTGNVLTFTPTDAIETNMRYEITFSDLMLDTYGRELGEEYSYYWVGKYSPLYASPRAIRARFRSAEQLPEDLTYWYIFRASLMAKAKFAIYMNDSLTNSLDSLTEAQVRDSADLVSHGLLLWVEACATYNLLKSILFEELRNVDRTRILQRFQDSLGPGFIEAIRLAMETAKEELQEAEGTLVPADSPISVPRYADFSPDYWTYDMFMGRDAGIRGLPLDNLGDY